MTTKAKQTKPTKQAVTKSVQAIIDILQREFVGLDNRFRKKQREWAKGRCEALQKYKPRKTDDLLTQRKTRVHIAGGKDWFNVFENGWSTKVAAYMRTNSEAVIEARNKKIVDQLKKVGILAIKDATFDHSDGFNGKFNVKTKQGNYTVEIMTVEAGGWNIQCYHFRTLVYVYPTKVAVLPKPKTTKHAA